MLSNCFCLLLNIYPTLCRELYLKAWMRRREIYFSLIVRMEGRGELHIEDHFPLTSHKQLTGDNLRKIGRRACYQLFLFTEV